MESIWHIANPQLREAMVYQPGKPIEETARELRCDAGEIVKLASNENPLGPSPKAVAALRESLWHAQFYPDGGSFYLRSALARKLDVGVENVILGNGSNEIIELLGHAFLQPGDDVVTSQHAFIAYKIIGRLFGARVIEAPSSNYGHDLDAIRDSITGGTKLIFIANPNNPTGTLLSETEIERFISRVAPHVIVAFDEAYFEFIDNAPDTIRYTRELRNVITLRTFSKIHGLAALRVGYAVAPLELIQVLQKTRQPFNVNGLAQIAALAALDDVEHQQHTKRVVDEGRAFLENEFRALKREFIPGSANFVLVNVGDGAPVFRALLKRKVIVRATTGYALPEWVRISIGTMEQNRKCIAALREIL